jgi:hypothetical protein
MVTIQQGIGVDVDPAGRAEEDIALGQGLADIAMIGLFQERAVKEQNIISPSGCRGR